MRADKAGKFIIDKLNSELPAHLTYHNALHVTDVHDAACRIAIAEDINNADLDLLMAAAWYHDSGFLVKSKGHEEESCRIAAEMLPGFGYNDNEIERIFGMIRATRLPQSPQNQLEQILADADLDYLGRDDFDTIGDQLFAELKHQGSITNRTDWDKMQLGFLESHHYFTKTAIDTRQAKKELNLATVKARLNNR